jgi:hypothetical protein
MTLPPSQVIFAAGAAAGTARDLTRDLGKPGIELDALMFGAAVMCHATQQDESKWTELCARAWLQAQEMMRK